MNRSYNKVLTVLLGIAIVISLLPAGTGCASIVPPTGGPRDSLPPVLVKVIPADSTVQFTGKKIVFNFNEYVQLDNIQQNLLASPTPKVNPVVQSKLRTITVEIKDTLEENTTYSLDFGNAIKDLNEGNVLRNYTYIFSTGKTLDSLELGGKVIIAETGKVDSTMIVVLHTSLDDSAVVKEKPRYVARVDSAGHFRFRNLPPDTFAIYALKDEGGMKRYLSPSQLFAFADSAVMSQSQKQDILLYAFVAPDTSEPKKPAAAPPKAPPKKGKEENNNALVLGTNLSGGLDLLSNPEISFAPDPLQTFDSTGLVPVNETFEPLRGYSFIIDSSYKKITIVYPWQENTKYHLLLDTTFATDTSGRRLLKNDTISFQTKKVSEYGLVRLRFRNLPLNRHPILQFLKADKVVYSHIFTNNEFYAKLFAPGEYDLRLVFDENRNGVWDTGQFFGKHIQPEKVQLIKRKITVKANWDNEVDIEL